MLSRVLFVAKMARVDSEANKSRATFSRRDFLNLGVPFAIVAGVVGLVSLSHVAEKTIVDKSFTADLEKVFPIPDGKASKSVIELLGQEMLPRLGVSQDVPGNHKILVAWDIESPSEVFSVSYMHFSGIGKNPSHWSADVVVLLRDSGNRYSFEYGDHHGIFRKNKTLVVGGETATTHEAEALRKRMGTLLFSSFNELVNDDKQVFVTVRQEELYFKMF